MFNTGKTSEKRSIPRKIANAFGFQRQYNFLFYFIFAGALLGFTLARFQYLNYNGIFCGGGQNGAAPGECYYYSRGIYKAGMIIHLGCILPASFLAIFQYVETELCFVPVIRHKAILLHRINGYAIIILVIVSIAGVFMFTRVSFGGELTTQAVVRLLAIMTILALGIAYISIKQLRIDRHRAWMLRAWFYLGSIITTRIIMIIAAQVITVMGTYWTTRPCAQIAYIAEGLARRYPSCRSYFDGGDPNAVTAIKADFDGDAAELGVALGVSFGMALFLALAIHAIDIEIYLGCTPAEAERLRKRSAERRAEAGMRLSAESDATC